MTGFAKAYRRERADVLVKAVDFAVDRKTAALADALIEETLRDPGAIEVGRAARPPVGRRACAKSRSATGPTGSSWTARPYSS